MPEVCNGHGNWSSKSCGKNPPAFPAANGPPFGISRSRRGEFPRSAACSSRRSPRRRLRRVSRSQGIGVVAPKAVAVPPSWEFSFRHPAAVYCNPDPLFYRCSLHLSPALKKCRFMTWFVVTNSTHVRHVLSVGTRSAAPGASARNCQSAPAGSPIDGAKPLYRVDRAFDCHSSNLDCVWNGAIGFWFLVAQPIDRLLRGSLRQSCQLRDHS